MKALTVLVLAVVCAIPAAAGAYVRTTSTHLD